MSKRSKRRVSGIFQVIPEINSEAKVEDLDEDMDGESSSRTLRTRIDVPHEEVCQKKPQLCTEKQITKYYLDKRVKLTNLSLETIYEEPQVSENSETVVMSLRKFRRLINFTGIASKNSAKIRRRKSRAKAVQPKKNKKIKIEILMEKLQEIEEG